METHKEEFLQEVLFQLGLEHMGHSSKVALRVGVALGEGNSPLRDRTPVLFQCCKGPKPTYLSYVQCLLLKPPLSPFLGQPLLVLLAQFQMSQGIFQCGRRASLALFVVYSAGARGWPDMGYLHCFVLYCPAG